MLKYSVLFQEDNYIYVEVEDGCIVTKDKINIDDFEIWKKDKVEF